MGDTPQLRIIDFFLDNKESDYSKKRDHRVYRHIKDHPVKVWNEILEFEYLKATRKYGKAQLYAINPDSVLVQKFIDLDNELGRQAMQKAIPIKISHRT